MNQHQQSSFKARRCALTAGAAALLIGACLSYRMPSADSPADSGILGTYIHNTEEGERIEMIFYEDGYFHKKTYSPEHDEWVSVAGTYFIQPDNQSNKLTVKLYNHPAYNPSEFSASSAVGQIAEDYSTIMLREGLFKRSDNTNTPLSAEDKNQIAGIYVLSYTSDEKIIIELELDGKGKIEERSRYPESEKIWTESGTYSVSFPSGAVEIEYHDRPDGKYIGILDVINGILYLQDGNYIRSKGPSVLKPAGD